MMTKPKRIFKFFPGLAFWGIVVLFFGLVYPYHVAFHEQYQLFLFSGQYFIELLSIPGGGADYIARFLTQFFLFPWLGAGIIASVLTLIQILFLRIIRLFTHSNSLVNTIVSFVPSIAIMAFLCDENAMLSLPIALLFALSASLTCMQIPKNTTRSICGVLLFPVLFWIAGSASIIFVALLLLHEILLNQYKFSIPKWIAVFSVFVLYVYAVLLASQLLVSYPLSRVLNGINYYRYPDFMPFIKNVALLLFVSISFLTILIHRVIKKEQMIWASIVLFLLVFGGGTGLIISKVDTAKEEAFAYNYMARMHQWNAIIQKAEKNPPVSSLASTCVNLALAKTGQLGNHMFQFPQYDKLESLLPKYQRDMMTPLFAGEVYYHLGMVNTAHRLAVEAMESIPDYQKSARCYKRIAEVSIINGNYKTARKYLNVLEETLFYRKWAKRAETLLFNDESVNKHPEFGSLRKNRIDEDFFFNADEQDIILALLLKKNSTNRVAFEYLMAYKLLERDITGFIKFFSLGDGISYFSIPVHFQEALTVLWSSQNKPLNEIPWEIDTRISNNMKAFIAEYNSVTDKKLLADKFGDTYWYYLLCEKDNK
ncbi:DUF6057 family protein [uncultured Draconibacterium sp.]|uniref:DUF6057 family protein n=1 Tax=uncultured Draconibacterium sp. TaxID=1573823 RepID=UPI0025E5FDE4|nr:DUF6057 family protein [uncultured Draconibacterium sp.]